LWDDTASLGGNEISVSLSGSCTLNHCCVDNTGYGGAPGNITENNCIHDDPLFVDADGADDQFGTADDDLHLQVGSPCIDAGDNALVPAGVTTDLDGNSRIVDGDSDGTATVDIGAYDYQTRIITSTLPDCREGEPFSVFLQAVVMTPPAQWSAVGLPQGLTLDSATGEISGTPASGTHDFYEIQVTLKDSSTPQQSTTRKLLLCVLPARSGVTTWYVDVNRGSDANSGADWNNAFKTIEWGLLAAEDGDTVVVADGVYNEYDLDFAGKKVTLRSQNGPANCVIDCRHGRAFLFTSGEDAGTVVDGFTVTGGSIDFGGAVYCESSSPALVNCVFENNDAAASGGAIHCKSSSPTIQNCTFSDNSAARDGGAVCCESNSSPTIQNCTFSDNSASLGGAISCKDSSSPTITDCTFNSNGADWGGAISYWTSGTPTISDCTFGSNSASQDGGAIYCDGSSPSITDCTFSGNSATGNGGAVYCENSSSPTVTNCAFSGNSSANYGGALCCWSGCSPTVTGCVFIGNGTPDFGGAVCCAFSSSPALTNCLFSGNSASQEGGAIWAYHNCGPTLNNCTLSGNSAANYGGAVLSNDTSYTTLNNCILWGNSASSGNEVYIFDAASSCTLNYCCVDNTGYGGQTGNITENTCIHDDPQFVDAANGDYHLRNTSPCIDKGNNSYVPAGVTTDLDGNQRVVDGDNDGTATVDIGAYEYQP